MFYRWLLIFSMFFPAISWAAEEHACTTLLKQSAQAGVSAQICKRQLNMEYLTGLHQQLQCGSYFADPKIKAQINDLAKQASHAEALKAKQMGEHAYCQQRTEALKPFFK